jgi:hypothetical protein
VSIQQSQTGPVWPSGGDLQTRASDADRDAAVGLLSSALAEGRLTEAEHGERLSAAYAARTWQQLRELTVDLPAAPGTVAERAEPEATGAPDRCLLCALLILCPPAGIAWWLRSRRRAPTA